MVPESVSNRPRSHQIEDQSRIAFQACLPKEWVYRTVSPDYGIDGSVEIFDEHDHATGKQFNVQLKATDEPDLRRALGVKLGLDKCEYYRSLDLPVLVARFHSPTTKIFVKWFHDFDPFYAGRGKKTTTFRLAESDEWSDNTASKLSLDLEGNRRLRTGNLPLPAPFRLQFRGQLIHGLSVAEISLSLREALQVLPSVLSLTADATAAWGTISISNEEVVVDLAGLKGFVLHFPKPYGPDLARKFLHHDVLIASALTLDSAGYSDPAARLMAEFALRSSLTTSPEIGVKMARCMAKAHRVREALALAEGLLVDRSSRPVVYTLMVSMLGKSCVMSQDERELLTRFLTRYVEEEEKTGDAMAAATANYNLGNYLRSLSYHRAAFRCYRKASKFDRKYLGRGYFCRELAGVLFLLERYKVAAKLYACALQVGAKGITRASFADALMFSGEYSDSLREFEAYINADQKPKSEAVLKTWALKGLQRKLKLGRQERQKSAARQLAIPGAGLPNDAFVNRLEEAFRLDALCGLAWFNLGILLGRQGKREDACIAFLWAALVQPKDAAAWANACMLSTFSTEYSALTLHIALAARFSSGEAFVKQLLMLADAQPEKFPKRDFLSTINEILTQVPKEKPTFEVRLLDENGNVKLPLK
jgi:tetratricopeptide (TPR) repeat protein